MSFLKKVRLVSIILLVGILGTVGGYKVGQQRAQAAFAVVKNGKQIDMGLFWQVWDVLNQKYLDKNALDSKKMVLGAISGMTSALDDPYTNFFPPVENKRSKEDLEGKFSGVGIQLGFIEKTIAVVAPLANNPAEKAGMKAGDLIIHIKDEQKKIDKDTSGMSLEEAVDLIRGKDGTEVILTVLREKENKPLVFNLTRATINIPSVEIYWTGKNGVKNIAWIRVYKFGEQTLDEWNKAVDEVIAKNAKGVVLDLRNNPGGYLQRAVDLASEFVADGVIVKQQGKDTTDTLSVDRKGRLIGKPLVVMINKGSASAAEILAGALRERLNVKLVGTNSFGKGTVQEVEDLPGGSGIHITIAKWLLPSGKNIHKVGIAPDVEIEYVANEKDPKADNQLDKAVEVLED